MEMRAMESWRLLIRGLIIQFCSASQLREVSLATCERKNKQMWNWMGGWKLRQEHTHHWPPDSLTWPLWCWSGCVSRQCTDQSGSGRRRGETDVSHQWQKHQCGAMILYSEIRSIYHINHCRRMLGCSFGSLSSWHFEWSGEESSLEVWWNNSEQRPADVYTGSADTLYELCCFKQNPLWPQNLPVGR